MILNTNKWKKIKLTKEQEVGLKRRKKLGYIITRSWRTSYCDLDCPGWVRVDLLNIKNGAVKSLYWKDKWQVAH